jgi:SpoVK/Ycf46/Vps4 family AAA+-type ATPase
VLLLDAQPWIENPVVQRLAREIAFDYTRLPKPLVFVGSPVDLPPALQRMSATFRLSLPAVADIRAIAKEEIELWVANNDGKRPGGSSATLELLCQHLVGLTRDDARRLIRQAFETDGAITMEDVARVLKHKHESLGAGGVLQLSTDLALPSDVGGQANLKRWLDVRRPAFVGEGASRSLDIPKGVLLLGVQGSGKSLAAKAVAGAWNVPLLRLDFGALYNKYHGETERNLREALRTAGAMAPSILWLDEIEKGLSDGGDSADGGVGRRILGTLLTWMSERKDRVFLVATANDIARLPAELMRKGRFDEIFFVDLPGEAVRREIFAIHLRKRGHAPEQFDLPALALAAEGFSGAEIEQGIIAASYEAHAAGRAIQSQDVARELAGTKPLSVVRAEDVRALRAWADARTVRAN